jgi:hypothetical protein
MILDLNQHRRGAISLAAMALLWLAPAAASAAAKTQTAKTPSIVFSPRGGVFATNVFLRISATGDATIRFTLDGSEPNANSPIHSASLQLTSTTVVRAKVFAKGAAPGATAAEIYTVLDDDLANFSSNLPLVFVNSFGTSIPHERKIEGAVQVVDGGKERTKWTSTVDFSGRCLINVRGRASLRYPKNSFTVKTINGEGDPANVSILGFPPESDWVLYAPFPDKTLMRDVLAYELHREMGHWAPRTKFVEVFVNQTGKKVSRRDYVGVYVFEEKIKRDKAASMLRSSSLKDDSEPRITGGYIFKKDHTDNGPMVMAGDIGGYGMAGGTSSSTRAGFPTGPGSFPGDPRGFQPAARSGFELRAPVRVRAAACVRAMR